MQQILTEWRKYLAEQSSVSADPVERLTTKYRGVVTGEKIKIPREDRIELQKVGRFDASAAKILAQYYKAGPRNFYRYWRKHYEKLSRTSLGRGKAHEVAKRMDYTFAQPEMQQAIIDGLNKGLTVAAIIMIASGVAAPVGAGLMAGSEVALAQGFRQALVIGGEEMAKKGLGDVVAGLAVHVGGEKALAKGATYAAQEKYGLGTKGKKYRARARRRIASRERSRGVAPRPRRYASQRRMAPRRRGMGRPI